jgi:hypothetical protein
VALAAVCVHTNRHFFDDDSYITMRYARHVMEGLGPRWNLTGAPVEGFTSPVHLLLLALLGTLHIPLLTATRVIGFGSHIVLTWFVWRFVTKGSGAMAGALAGAMVAASWPLLVWDLGGLDAVLFVAVGTAATLTTLRFLASGQRRDLQTGGLLLGLTVFVRMDGAVLGVASLLACLLMGAASLRERVVGVAQAAGLCALVFAPWEVFRLAYFHAVLPNTYYAKVWGVPAGWRWMVGREYFDKFVETAPYTAWVLPVLVVVLLVRRRVTRFDVGLWVCLVVYSVYIISCGGDHMVAFRFMVPLVPLLAVGVARAVQEAAGVETAVFGAVVSVALAALTATQISSWRLNPVNVEAAGLVGAQVGVYIDRHWAPGSLVAINVAGSTAYFADRMNFIDMLGLNDREIARRSPLPEGPHILTIIGHRKGDGASVLARRPEYIIAGAPNGVVLKPEDDLDFLGDYELAHSREFGVLYKPCGAWVPLAKPVSSDQMGPTTQFYLIYYQRRDLETPCTPAA